jgi:dihydropteroate synthase
MMTVKARFHTLNCRGRLIVLDKPLVMGILNVTPDSFYDGGKFFEEEYVETATKKAAEMVKDGADIIDIGGYSTRPGAVDVPVQEEINRVKPVISSIRRENSKVLISVDTFRPEVAEQALLAGADIINDVTAGEDKNMPLLTKKYNAPYIIMHKQGSFQNMQENPRYDDVVKDVTIFLAEKINQLKNLGVNDIIVDPGFGFGKNLQHNYELLKNLSFLKETGFPVMAGISRKSMINKLLKTKPENALPGTIAVNTIALLNGADILRVHDVKEAVQTIKIVEYYKNFNQEGVGE